MTTKLQTLPTPFYYYDTQLLRDTLAAIKAATQHQPHFHVHYAVKACVQPDLLRIIAQSGFGADCVSGGEIRTCLEAGFPANKIVYAGVGKSDWEIELALEAGIEYFNVESHAELEVIDEIARRRNQVARVSFRINPNVGAHTHAHITTGLSENKFGIAMAHMKEAIRAAQAMEAVEFVGLHFHIGSQILEMEDFEALAHRINELQDRLEAQGFGVLPHVNVGGGLGIDYAQPTEHPIPDFESYFATFATHLKTRPGQEVHFELGRAVVAQCGSLYTRCLYVKEADTKRFAIVDAGMTDLIRPALYDALHRIENVSSDGEMETYDIVGPICESSDVFARDYSLPHTRRGDLLVIRSAGAYGQVMASQYNCRALAKAYTDEDLA